MHIPTLLPLLPIVLAASPSVVVDGHTCTVVPLGGGQDDAPSILDAFRSCGSGGTVVLDKYYVVNTVLVITGVRNVSIVLSGVGGSILQAPDPRLHSFLLSTIHPKYCVLVTQLLLYGVPERVRSLLRSLVQTPTLPSTTFWFLSGDNIHLYGGGTLDANGQVWWDYPNKVLSLPSHPDSRSQFNRLWELPVALPPSLRVLWP